MTIAVGLILAFWIACHNSSRDAFTFTSAGVTHLQMHEYDRAIRDFDRAIAIQPGLVVAWRQRGLAYRGKGDFERALADFDQAIVLAPSDARLHTERGSVHELLGDYANALGDFDRAIALKPNHAPAIESRGRTYFLVGNFAQAAADLQRGLVLDSANVEIAIWLHLARQRLRQDDSEDFAAQGAMMDTVQWPSPVMRYMLGELRVDSLRALAARAELRGQSQACVVGFYLGEDALVRGETSRATTLFDESRTGCSKELTEQRAAAAELKRLGAPR
jgi:lipoprotein NlpI